MTDSIKYFTLAEANNALPFVRKVVSDILESYSKWQDRVRNFELVIGSDNAIIETDTHIQARAAVEEILCEDMRMHVVVGSLNKRLGQIESQCREIDRDLRLYHDVQDMADIYAGCDLALCSAGTTFWELCLFGVRSLMFAASEREAESAALLDKLGYTTLAHQFGDTFDRERFSAKLANTSNIAPDLAELDLILEKSRVVGHI